MTPEEIALYTSNSRMSAAELTKMLSGGINSGNNQPKSIAERVFTGLDKPGSATRLSIEKALGINTDGTTYGDVLLRDKEINARHLLDSLGASSNRDLEFGSKEDGYTGMDKVGNFITELGVNIVTDPLTYVGGGLFDKAHKSIQAMGFSENVAKNLARASIGAGIGLSSSSENDSAGGVLMNTIIGAGTLGLGGPALRSLGKALGQAGNGLVDMTQAGLHPEIFGSQAVQDIGKNKYTKEVLDGVNKTGMTYSQAFDINAKASQRLGFVPREVQKLNKEFIANMTPDQMEVVAGFVDSKHTLFHTYRNELELGKMADQVRARGGDAAIDKASKIVKSAIDKAEKPLTATEFTELKKDALIKYGAKRLKIEQLDELTNVVNTRVMKEADIELAKRGDPILTENVARYIKRNRDIIKQSNTYNRAVAERSGKEFRDVLPIDFHTFEIIDPDSVKVALGNDTFNNIKTGFVRRASEDPIKTGGLNLAQRLELQSERLVTTYMNQEERTARKLISLAENSTPNNPTAAAISNFFDKYDGMTNFIKKQHLFFSHNWVVNNYTENVARAYMSGGAGNAWETLLNQSNAALRNADDALVKDLLTITDPKLAKKGIEFNNNLMSVALDYGAIEKGFFQDIIGKNGVTNDFLIAKKGTSGAKEAIENAGKQGFVGNMQDFMSSTVGRTGSMIEGASRYTTFKHHIDKILSSDEMLAKLGVTTDKSILAKAINSPEIRKQAITIPTIGKDLDLIFKNASDITGEIFFNYQNVSSFEQKVMKRIFPYWTFFSRNAPFWLEKAGENPEALSQLGNVIKSTGAPLTEQERTKLPDYMLKTLPRSVGGGKYVTVPNLSMFDATNQIGSLDESYAKLHPAIKVAKELTTGKDQYGTEILPSNTSKGMKKATSSATKFEPFTDTLRRDSQGRLMVTNDMAQIALALQQALLPTSLIDTAANAISDSIRDKKTLLESAINLGPIKTREVTPFDSRNTIKYRKREKTQDATRAKQYAKYNDSTLDDDSI
jgi:hypothetical protein